MQLTERVRQILSWYPSDNPGTKASLARFLMTGRLAGTGRLVILPVDQGFEHGPDRSFAPNPAGYDPNYHPDLAVEAGCNGYAAPLGLLEAAADRHPGTLPLILKANNSDLLGSPSDAGSAVTGSVDDALRLAARRSASPSTRAPTTATRCTPRSARWRKRRRRRGSRSSSGAIRAATDSTSKARRPSTSSRTRRRSRASSARTS